MAAAASATASMGEICGAMIAGSETAAPQSTGFTSRAWREKSQWWPAGQTHSAVLELTVLRFMQVFDNSDSSGFRFLEMLTDILDEHGQALGSIAKLRRTGASRAGSPEHNPGISKPHLSAARRAAGIAIAIVLSEPEGSGQPGHGFGNIGIEDVWQHCVWGTERFEIIQQTSTNNDNKQSGDLYCRKGSSGRRGEGDMVSRSRRRSAIGGRRHACQIAKVVNKVRLVGVAVLGRNRAPVNTRRTLNRS